MLLGLGGNVPLEVGHAPGNGHTEAARGRSEALVEPPQRILELPLCLPTLGRALAHTQGRRDGLMVEWRDQHVDPVVVNDTNSLEEVLLRRHRAGHGRVGGAVSSSTSL